METLTPVPTETKNRLRKMFLAYGLSAMVLLITLSGAILTKKYADSLYATLDRLQEFNIQHIKVRAAIDDIDKSSARIKTLLPQPGSGQSVEEHMLLTLDDIKMKAGSAEVAVSNIEDKGADFQLSVTIRSPLKDYSSLVHFVGYLQSLKFPFFGITGIKIQKSEDPASSLTMFELKGALKYPKAEPSSQEAVAQRTPGKL